MSEAVRFGWGPEGGHRILAPGLPDVVFASDGLVVWINAAGFWMWKDDAVAFHPVREPVDVRVGVERSILCFGGAGAWAVETYCNRRLDLLHVRRFEGRSIQCGTDLVVVDTGIERLVYSLSDGHEVRVPVGARDAHPRAWAHGRGITWIDQGNVYSLREGHRVRLVCRLPVEPTEWIVGPHGTAVFGCGDVTLVVHQSGSVHEFPPIDFQNVCFRSDGAQMLCVSESGIVHLDLETGGVIDHKSGLLVPVGFRDHPIVLDEDAGILKWLGGSTICRGFSPSAAALYGDILYGPGGTAWSVQAEERIWKESPLCGLFLVGHEGGVFQIDDRIIGYDLSGKRVIDIPLPIDEDIDGDIVDVHWDGESFDFDMGDRSIRVDLQGNRTGAAGSQSASRGSETRWAEPCLENANMAVEIFQTDGHLPTPAGRWLWGDDGMLLIVR